MLHWSDRWANLREREIEGPNVAMTKSPPFVSVIVPHLNMPEQLLHCLQSLMGQGYPRDRFEVIVVDNGSSEVPLEVVDRFDGVRLEREMSPGPGPARNRGVAPARGDILAFIDADCTADKRWLETIAQRFEMNKGELILGGDVRIAIKDPQRLTMLEAYESVFAYRQKEYIEKQGFSGTGNLAVRRHDFDAIGPFAGISVAEDRDWGRRARSLGYDVVYMPEMIVFHPARENFDELFEKWNRHLRHDLQEYQRRGARKIRWVLRACAVAISPIVDVRRIVGSHRISGFRARVLALVALVRIRSYRAIRMIRLAIDDELADAHIDWNKASGSD